MDKFKDIAKQMGVCIAQSENIATTADNEAYDALVSNLMQSANASVVVCFCEGGMVRRLLQTMIRKKVEGRYLVIGRWVKCALKLSRNHCYHFCIKTIKRPAFTFCFRIIQKPPLIIFCFRTIDKL